MKRLALYIATIVAANWMTSAFGMVGLFGITVTAGTFAAGLALVARDGVQIRFGWKVVAGAILVGAFLSYITSDPMVAIASGIAFLFSEFVDLAVFTPMKNNLTKAIIASSVVAAPVDTILFLHIAGFGVTPSAVLGQFIVKTILAAVVALGLKCYTSREA